MRTLSLLAGLALAPAAAGQDELDDALASLPDLFAGVLGVTLAEEISGATLRIDGSGAADDTRLHTLRLPWHDDFVVPGLHGRLHLEAVAGLMLAEDHLGAQTASGFATVDQDWTLAGGQVGAGWGFPLGSSWWLRPGATLALAYLENDARYNEAGKIEFAPLIDGLLVNWDGWAVSPAGNLTLERERDLARRDWGLEGRYSVASTSVFSASSEAQEGSDTSRTLAARAELGAPFGPAGAESSSWDAFLGGVRFFDVDPGTLGFDGFLELGLGWTRSFPRVGPLRFEAGWIVGEDVRGYSLGVGLGPRLAPAASDP
ncbi:MAG TPA: Solitary outer membrane autotransporter beta-barrel domain [Planctomycetota bacterium]